MIKVLVLNAGSSSLKFQVFNMVTEAVLAQGLAEKIGESKGRIRCKGKNQKVWEAELPIDSHEDALEKVANFLVHPEWGVIENINEISAIGHRVVHGGESFQRSTVITPQVIRAIEKMSLLAPLHNPPNLIGIQVSQKIFPQASQVAVFDTAFHQTMPDYAFTYALPYELYKEDQVRRYGFHGTSHAYVARCAAEFLNHPKDKFNAVTIHAGNGVSMAAIRGGKCVDTSMGLTPLEGLVMGTRCGDLDPSMPFFLSHKKGWDLEQTNEVLNKKSGLKGLCGTNDLREVWRLLDEGQERARLAIDIYAYRIKKYIGAYMAAIGSTHAIIFTAGVGENDHRMRAQVLEGLESFGIVLDEAANQMASVQVRQPTSEGGGVSLISSGAIRVLVVPTNEELEIARQALTLI